MLSGSKKSALTRILRRNLGGNPRVIVDHARHFAAQPFRADIQFSKAEHVLEGMELAGLIKSEEAIKETGR